MAARTEQLAQRFEYSNQRFIATVESISDADWSNVCPAENWTVGVTAHHVGDSYSMAIDVLQALAVGLSRPVTIDMLNELNAEHARKHADCTRDETSRLLRIEGARAAAAIRSLKEESLDTTHFMPFLGNTPVSLEQFVDICLIRHHDAHLPSIRDAAPSASSASYR